MLSRSRSFLRRKERPTSRIDNDFTLFDIPTDDVVPSTPCNRAKSSSAFSRLSQTITRSLRVKKKRSSGPARDKSTDNTLVHHESKRGDITLTSPAAVFANNSVCDNSINYCSINRPQSYSNSYNGNQFLTGNYRQYQQYDQFDPSLKNQFISSPFYNNWLHGEAESEPCFQGRFRSRSHENVSEPVSISSSYSRVSSSGYGSSFSSRELDDLSGHGSSWSLQTPTAPRHGAFSKSTPGSVKVLRRRSRTASRSSVNSSCSCDGSQLFSIHDQTRHGLDNSRVLRQRRPRMSQSIDNLGARPEPLGARPEPEGASAEDLTMIAADIESPKRTEKPVNCKPPSGLDKSRLQQRRSVHLTPNSTGGIDAINVTFRDVGNRRRRRPKLRTLSTQNLVSVSSLYLSI